MSPTFQSLGIDRLSRDERIALVQEIWASIAAESRDSMLSDPQRKELERRLVEADANPDEVIPWEQVKAEVQARLKS